MTFHSQYMRVIGTCVVLALAPTFSLHSHSFGGFMTTDALSSQPQPQRLASVANFRPVSSGVPSLYRSATLDELSLPEAEQLLEVPSLTILDLRNRDEIDKGQAKRTHGSTLFYDSMNSKPQNLQEIPILQNVNAFWDVAIDRLPLSTRTAATLQTVWEAGALDRAAARHLEQGGLSALYTVMLTSAGSELCQALQVCHQHLVYDTPVEQEDSLLVFHCQKGKDRTGVLAMLLQSCFGDSAVDIVQSYAMSGELLGEEARSTPNTEQQKSSSGLVDWSHFRGSPEPAMQETLTWIQERYGSVDAYLDSIGFSRSYRQDLKEWKQQRQ